MTLDTDKLKLILRRHACVRAINESLPAIDRLPLNPLARVELETRITSSRVVVGPGVGQAHSCLTRAALSVDGG